MTGNPSRWWRRGAIAAAAMLVPTLAIAAPASAAPSDRTTTVAVTGASQADGLTLQITGSGYTGLPNASTGAPAAGIYVALRDPATMTDEAINDNNGIVPASTYLRPGPAGDWTTNLTAPADALDENASYEIITWVAHGHIAPDTLLATEPVTLTDAQRDALFPATRPGSSAPNSSAPSSGEPTRPATTPSKTTSAKTTASRTTMPRTTVPRTTVPSETPTAVVTCRMVTVPGTAGTPQLSWGVESTFVAYVQGGIAKGTVTTTGGAARAGSGFTWGSGTGALDHGAGTLTFPGSVAFTGHGGALALTLSDLRVTSTGSGTGTLVADVRSKDMNGQDVSGNDVALATLRLSGISDDGGRATATLTAAGAQAFAGFYSAGHAMAPLTISFAGKSAPTTEKRCYDGNGKLVGPNGASADVDALAATGSSASTGIGVGVALVLAGLLLLVAQRRRSPAAHR